MTASGQIIATSHDLTPNDGLVREIPLLKKNQGWWNIRPAASKLNVCENLLVDRTRPMRQWVQVDSHLPPSKTQCSFVASKRNNRRVTEIKMQSLGFWDRTVEHIRILNWFHRGPWIRSETEGIRQIRIFEFSTGLMSGNQYCSNFLPQNSGNLVTRSSRIYRCFYDVFSIWILVRGGRE